MGIVVRTAELLKHVTYGLSKINDWRSDGSSSPIRRRRASSPPRTPLWTRAYWRARREECALLEQRDVAGRETLVMGHTVQRNGINPACGEKAWRIDVGMSKFYGGPIQALEIKGDVVSVLRAAP